MNISMNWLKDYVDIDCDIKTFTDAMTISGSKVEVYEELGKEVSNVVVGKILKIERHPDADKLIVCQVDVGTEKLQIVTGAKNVNEGDLVPIALHGSSLPGGVKIKKGKLRGVESNGMMCSVEELGFEAEDFIDAPEDGIYIIKDEYPLGTDAKEVFGLNDEFVEFEITSNRQDCFSIIGLAREAAATFNKEFKYQAKQLDRSGNSINDYVSVHIENKDLCRRYIAKVVKNVKIEPSPKWMQDRLRTVGLRPINNIVDITNYVLLEMGQPMHAFDLDLLKNKKIIVRTAKDGEVFTTLDGEERTLDADTLMICDGDESSGIAGIMGGENSKVLDTTKTILFESANFNGTNIRVSSKKLGLRTDASGKFEKDLDPNLAEEGLARAIELIEELGAGEVVDGVIDVYPSTREPKVIDYSVEKINALIGLALSEDEMIRMFKLLGFNADKENKKLIIPTYRQDIDHNADLAEEVARIYGYDKIEPTLIKSSTTVGRKSYKQTIEDILKYTLEANGISEALTYSFESAKVFNKLMMNAEEGVKNAVIVSNPLGEDFSVMRTQTINGLLNSLSVNYNRRNKEAFLYEIARMYIPTDNQMKDLPEEKTNLTLAMYGDIDFYDVKGVVESVFDSLGIHEEYNLNSDIPHMHPGVTADITVNNNSIGYIGEVHPEVLNNYEIGTKAYLVCISVDALVDLAELWSKYTGLPKYPAVNRDLAILIDESVPVREIEKVIEKKAGKILEAVDLFDVYQGEQVENGKKSVAYSITYRAADRTLTEEEITNSVNKILETLEKELGAKLR